MQQDNVWLYLDAGHSGWLGWPANLQPAADMFASVLQGAGSGAVSPPHCCYHSLSEILSCHRLFAVLRLMYQTTTFSGARKTPLSHRTRTTTRSSTSTLLRLSFSKATFRRRLSSIKVAQASRESEPPRVTGATSLVLDLVLVRRRILGTI